jgi:hypothetical protein
LPGGCNFFLVDIDISNPISGRKRELGGFRGSKEEPWSLLGKGLKFESKCKTFYKKKK